VPEIRAHLDGGHERHLLVWRWEQPRLIISSGPLGGGVGVRRWALNVGVHRDYDRPDPDAHLTEIADGLGLAGDGVGLLTAVDVRQVHRADDAGVVVEATVGVGDPVLAAGPDPTWLAEQRAGTINIVAQLPVHLSPAALVNAVATVTEAKVQALADAGHRATGTPTDALCVVVPTDGPAEPYAGPRSRWGARLARAAHAAVLAGARP